MTDDDTAGDAVPIDDWPAVERALRGFDARVDADDEGNRLVLRAGHAEFAVTRDGRVDAGMPLHGFDAERIDRLVVDHDAGVIRIAAGGVDYEFRVP